MRSGLTAGTLLLRVNGRSSRALFVHGFDNAVVGGGTAIANETGIQSVVQAFRRMEILRGYTDEVVRLLLILGLVFAPLG
jgi:hypothetical protein